MQVNVVYDTVTKELKCSIDGKELDNSCCVEFYKCCDDDEKWNMSLRTSMEDEESKMRTYTSIIASKNGFELTQNKPESIPDDLLKMLKR